MTEPEVARAIGAAGGFHCEYVWLGGDGVVADVLVAVADGRITEVRTGAGGPPDGVHRLSGLVLPGLVNTHSHVFHRVIRGRTQSGAGDFWAWREAMYAVAGRLDPDLLYRLALATYAEMALAGITCVGEFFYLHHPSRGGRYDDPNVMGRVVLDAARDAGIRITLLDTCYLQAGVDGSPLTGVQRRFDDGSVEAWARPPGRARRRSGRQDRGRDPQRSRGAAGRARSGRGLRP